MGRYDEISAKDLLPLLGQEAWPCVVDVRRPNIVTDRLPAAVWHDHRQASQWGQALTRKDLVVVYCAHGEQLSRSAVALMRAEGINAVVLEGGMDAWRAAGGPVVADMASTGLSVDSPSHWVTRRRPKVDRIACPWLIHRFIDATARIHFVEASSVTAVAAEIGALPFDIPRVALTHIGERCTFDALMVHFGMDDPVLDRLALIVRGADTGRLDLAPECAGLLAISLGLSATYENDEEMLSRGLGVYDALYGWLRLAAGETHGWAEPREG